MTYDVFAILLGLQVLQSAANALDEFGPWPFIAVFGFVVVNALATLAVYRARDASASITTR